MSSITKNWTEEDFRKELRKIDHHVMKTKGIALAGAELDIEFSKRARHTLGQYYPVIKKFRFSLPFFNSDVPEACAIDVIRHEYAHYYNDVVFGISRGHGAQFKATCRIVGANPSTYYSKTFEAEARNREEKEKQVYESAVKTGQQITHPTFGKGIVKSVDSKKETALITIDFGKFGLRVIDEVWLKNKGLVVLINKNTKLEEPAP